MTDAELSALAAAAKAATLGPFTIPEGYKIYAVEKHFASAFERYSYNKDEVIDSEQAKANAAFIAAADPSLILDLIAELRQTRELCGEHNQYIAELERTIKIYDNFVKSLAESLCIKHEEGWMPELDLIRAQMQLLKEITCSRKA